MFEGLVVSAAHGSDRKTVTTLRAGDAAASTHGVHAILTRQMTFQLSVTSIQTFGDTNLNVTTCAYKHPIYTYIVCI